MSLRMVFRFIFSHEIAAVNPGAAPKMTDSSQIPFLSFWRQNVILLRQLRTTLWLCLTARRKSATQIACSRFGRCFYLRSPTRYFALVSKFTDFSLFSVCAFATACIKLNGTHGVHSRRRALKTIATKNKQKKEEFIFIIIVIILWRM